MLVVIVKPTLVWFAGTVTVDGTWAADVLSLDRLTIRSSDVALFVISVAETEFPPVAGLANDTLPKGPNRDATLHVSPPLATLIAINANNERERERESLSDCHHRSFPLGLSIFWNTPVRQGAGDPCIRNTGLVILTPSRSWQRYLAD